MVVGCGGYSRPGALWCYSPDKVFDDRQALPTASLHGTVCSYPRSDSFHLGPLHSLSTSPFIHQTLLPLKRQPKNSGSHYKQSTVSSLLAYEQNVTPDDLSHSTCTSLVHRKEVIVG